VAWSRPLLLAALVALLALAPGRRGRSFERLLRRLSAFMARASYGRLRVSGEVAPVVAGARRPPGGAIPPEELTAALRAAGSRGVRMDGAIPMFIAAWRQDARSFATSSWAVIRGRGWTRLANTVAHELAHVLGLDHAAAPQRS
jgi:hypothetical protein